MNEGSYYLDRALTLAESTCRFSGGGREIPVERHYVVAIRRRGHSGWVFRFSPRYCNDLESMVSTLNRPPRPALTTERPSLVTDGAVITAAQPSDTRVTT
jgi:hypothetical protein